MNKKVIFIDYDGTLYHEKTNRPTEEAYKLLELAISNNIDIYLTTGRNIPTLSHEQRLLKTITGLIGADGSLIYENGLMKEIHYIPEEDIEQILNFCKINNCQIAFFSGTKAYTYFYDKERLARFKVFNKLPVVEIDNSNEIIEPIELICLYTEEENIDRMVSQLPKFTIYKWGSYGADVISKGYTKGRAVKKVINDNCYNFNNTYAIGDGLNDIEMFKVVKTSIAMGNAKNIIKEHATIITSDITENGLEIALTKIINNEI